MKVASIVPGSGPDNKLEIGLAWGVAWLPHFSVLVQRKLAIARGSALPGRIADAAFAAVRGRHLSGGRWETLPFPPAPLLKGGFFLPDGPVLSAIFF